MNDVTNIKMPFHRKRLPTPAIHTLWEAKVTQWLVAPWLLVHVYITLLCLTVVVKIFFSVVFVCWWRLVTKISTTFYDIVLKKLIFISVFFLLFSAFTLFFLLLSTPFQSKLKYKRCHRMIVKYDFDVFTQIYYQNI